jgi:hypothetical protein
MIVSYISSGVNKLKASLNDDARVVIYDHYMFIVQATCGENVNMNLNVVQFFNDIVNSTSVAALGGCFTA